jgi:aminopeptidase N
MVSTWRPINYDVVLSLDDKLSDITKARVEINVQVLKNSLNVIDLDFGDLSVDAVTLDGQTVKFERAPGLINVYLPVARNNDERLSIAVDYHGRPKDGLILAADKDGKPSATGDNWPNRLHHWIPCLDHPSAKATVKFTVTAPGRDLVVANGKLATVTEAGQSTRTWTYNETVPIPAYCMVIAVGEYARFEPTPAAITALSYYVPQSDGPLAIPGFIPAAPSLKLFSETIAPYPYEKLALIVGATRFGGMENSSAIVFASNVLSPRSNPRMSRAFNISEGLETVVAHEIAHQWFGDSVTEANWSDIWLSEGFASYFAGLFIQKNDGEEAFQDYMKRAAQEYLAFSAKKRTPIYDTETENLMALLNPNSYQKGSWVLHMLRSELGDKAFFSGIRSYYAAHKNSTATSEDLRAALETASGKDLKQFFASWVYGPGHPIYEVSWRYLPKEMMLQLTLKQTQPEEYFPNSVPITIPINLQAGSAQSKVVLHPQGKVTVQDVHLTQQPGTILIDPENTILKEVVMKGVGG